MLRAWHAPTSICCWAKDIADTMDEEDGPFTYTDPDTGGEPTCGDSLFPMQLNDPRTIWQKFYSVFNSNPRCTNIVEHSISTGQARLIRLPPYRIPYTYREAVRDKLRQMAQDGIIEKSSSEWGVPVVVVKKKTRPFACAWTTAASMPYLKWMPTPCPAFMT